MMTLMTLPAATSRGWIGERIAHYDLLNITEDQLNTTFRTNIYTYFFMAKAALPHLKEGSAIVNTTSVTAYRGSKHLIDYASTKGAIVGFTRSRRVPSGLPSSRLLQTKRTWPVSAATCP